MSRAVWHERWQRALRAGSTFRLELHRCFYSQFVWFTVHCCTCSILWLGLHGPFRVSCESREAIVIEIDSRDIRTCRPGMP